MTDIVNKYVNKLTDKLISKLESKIESYDITSEAKNLSSVNSISSFRSKLESKKGVARTNQFMVSFSLPTWITESSTSLLSYLGVTNFNDELGILCNKVTPPSKNVQNLSVKYGNFVERKIPTGYKWNEATFSFIERNDYFIYTLFNEWMDGINNPITNTGRFYNEIVSDVKINFLNKNNDILAYCTLYEAYPSAINISDYNWGQDNQFVSIDVTFNYIYTANRDYNITMLTNAVAGFGESDVANTIKNFLNIETGNVAHKIYTPIKNIFTGGK